MNKRVKVMVYSIVRGLAYSYVFSGDIHCCVSSILPVTFTSLAAIIRSLHGVNNNDAISVHIQVPISPLDEWVAHVI